MRKERLSEAVLTYIVLILVSFIFFFPVLWLVLASFSSSGSGRCKVHACAREHGVQFCGLCAEFPCEKLPTMISWNPNIINHLLALRDEYNKLHKS